MDSDSEARGAPLSVLIISYHFFPSNEIGARRATALARFLAEQGVRVTAVSAFGGHSIEWGSEVLPGVVAVPVQKPARRLTAALVYLKRTLIRRRSIAHNGYSTEAIHLQTPAHSFWTKLRETYFRAAYFIDEYKSWGRRALKASIREGKKRQANVIFSSAPPPTVLWVGTLTARRLGIPHIVDLRDPWSDTISTLHPERLAELRIIRAIERWVMRSATAITSTGSNVAGLLIGREPGLGAKTSVVRNGYDNPVVPTSLDTGKRLAILFAGELYLNRDPIPLLNALERLVARPDVDSRKIRVTFMGRKTEFTSQALQKWLAGKRCASIVTFIPPQPPDIVKEASLQATVLLNLAQHQPLSVPAKTFEHLASGRENLLLCENDSESAQIVANIPGVIQVDPGNPEALDRVLLDLYQRHVNQGRLRAPTESDVAVFSRISANEALWKIMRSVTVSPPDQSLEHSRASSVYSK